MNQTNVSCPVSHSGLLDAFGMPTEQEMEAKVPQNLVFRGLMHLNMEVPFSYCH